MIKDAMEKNEKATPNGADLEVLKKHFGMCFNNDGSLDLEKLKARLGDQVAISNEGYELKFLGKNYARLLTSLETETVVVPDKEHNEKPENAKSKNVYISGDNLDALKHLLKSKQGQVKCIYIDPPYNTGSDGFVYNDSFGFKVEELASKLSISENEAQRILDFTKRGSASHSAWLMFMYPRLMLARELLAKDGVIFISIDDNEQANLKLMCDEIFGETNFVGEVIWQTATDNNLSQISIEHEYVICYARRKDLQPKWFRASERAVLILNKYAELKKSLGKNIDAIRLALREWISKNKKQLDGVSHYTYVDEKGVYYPGNSSNTRPGGYVFDIVHPVTQKVCAKPEYGYRWPEDTFNAARDQGDVDFGDDETYVPKIKKRLETVKDTLKSYYYEDNRYWTQYLNDLLGSYVFDNPKSVDLIRHLIRFVVTREDDIVVDFFSGSATTAESIMRMNAKDRINRQYILVQLPENLDNRLAHSSGKNKLLFERAITFLDSIGRPHSLDEIGIERIKRAAAKIAAENPLLAKTMDLGFKHYTLKEVEGKTLDKIEKFDLNDNALAATDDILKEFGVETVLATWLVHDGYGFSAEPKVVDLDGYKAYWMEKHVYLIEPGLSDKGISALFDKFETDGTFNPGNVVVFGYSFSWTQLEALKNNLLKIAANGTNKHVLLDKRY